MLKYKYKNIYKNVFTKEYKQSNIIKNDKNFLIKIENFKLYIIEFKKDNIIKRKLYPLNCIIKENEC